MVKNVSEKPHMRSTIFGNGRSSKQIVIGVSLFIVFLMPQSKDLFQISCVKFGESLASVLHLIRQMPESSSMLPEGACNKS